MNKSGFFAFFRFLAPSAVVPWQRVLASFPYAGTPPWLHHTRIEVQSPCERRWQKTLRLFSAT
jgi:hypothetical protein